MNLRIFGLIVLASLLSTGCPSTRFGWYPVAYSGVRRHGADDRSVEPPGLGAYAYVVLARDPSADSAYAGSVCRAFFSTLPPTPATPSPAQMVTFWPLRRDAPPQLEGRADHCGGLVTYYDWGWASTVSQQLGFRPRRLGIIAQAREPLNAGYAQRDGVPRLGFDMSDVDEADLPSLFHDWGDRIARAPDQWNRGFAVETIRDVFRRFLAAVDDAIRSL